VRQDFREPPLRTRLLKFHGCAVRACANPGVFRPMLVGRESQIVSWPHDANTAVMRQQLIGLATTSRTLAVGLSAQDGNIKDVFVQGACAMRWTWPSHPLAYVFAGERLGEDQRTVLRCVCGTAYDDHRAAIEGASQIRSFAKSLLTALVLEVLFRKLVTFVYRAPAPRLHSTDFEALSIGLRTLRDRLAEAAEPDRLTFITALIAESTRALSLFREGRPPSDPLKYQPLGIQPLNMIDGDPGLITSGLPELAATLAILGLGEARGDWKLERSSPSELTSGIITVTPNGSTAAQKIHFVANVEASLQLFLAGAVRDDEPDAIIFYSTAPIRRLPRSPRVAPGRTGAAATREVGVRPLLGEAGTLADFQKRLREEAIL
jgi:uncharacterized membrane protein